MRPNTHKQYRYYVRNRREREREREESESAPLGPDLTHEVSQDVEWIVRIPHNGSWIGSRTEKKTKWLGDDVTI